nr:Fic family protein [Sedimentibacter sp.]
MDQDYSYTYSWDNVYCYPNSDILKNKLNIKDKNNLNIAERELTSLRLAEIEKNQIKGIFDIKHLQDIHRYIFQDIYGWSGQIRCVNIAKGNMFCYSENILSYGELIFQKLKEEDYLINIQENKIYGRLSYYMSEINALHPFREGNGRAQRVFISSLGKVAGFEIDFKQISNSEMIKISSSAFVKGHEEYNKMFEKITKKISKKEQEEHIILISHKDSPILKKIDKLKK